jgi:hypothetical protein
MSISVALNKWGPRVRSQVQKFAARWPTFSWGTYPGHDPSEALATDGMVPGWNLPGGRTKGRKVAQAIWDERKENGVWYVIHWGEIISITRPEKGWLPYFARNDPNPSKSHKNHVHVSWHSDKAAPVASPSAPAKPEPKPYTDGWVPDTPWVFYLDKQDIGVKQSDSVWLLQKALGLKVRDGNYTAELRDAVKTWQLDVLKDDPEFCDGILVPAQAQALFSDAIDIEASSK